MQQTNSVQFENKHSFNFFRCLLTLFFVFNANVYSQTVITLTSGSSWNVPCGVSSITVECWGAGGGGGASTGNVSAGGGGTGGGYIKGTYNVGPYTSVSYSIGTGGSGTTSGSKNGTSTWFGSNTTLLAVGGNGASNISSSNTFGTGATAPSTGNIGGTLVSSYGGNGGTASSVGTDYSGGGGSSGGSTAAGNASGMTAGIAPTNGYAGASGRNNNGDGSIGGIGSGGSGGRTDSGTDRNGGNGGGGQIRITYNTISSPASIAVTTTSVCPGGTTTLSTTGSSSEFSTLWFAASTCPTIGFSQEFQTIPYTTQQTTVNSVTDGILSVTSPNIAPPTADAQILMETIFSSAIDPVVQKYISIRYKITGGTGLYTDIYFKKNGQALAEDKRVEGALITDTNWHVLSIDMSTNANWNNTGGNITGWRFDYTRGQNVTMLIDYIILASHPVIENTSADDSILTISPTTDTAYYAIRMVESTCSYTTSCTNTAMIYAGKTWVGGSGNWTVAGNWSPAGMPSSSHCVQTSSGTVIVNGNGNAKNITLTGTAGLTISSGNTLTVENEVTVGTNASFVIENNGSLVQSSGAANTGNVTAIRNAKPMKRYDYTYWSSPVSAQTLYNLSPNTLFDKYYSWTPSTGWTIHYNGAQTMEIGKGYIVRAPQSFPINATGNYVSNFVGVPNNGEKIVPGFQGSTTQNVWNLVGNPYPSAIDLDLFFADADNSEVGGTAYIWTHNTPPINNNAGQYVYTSNDYASYNMSGGTATAAPDDPNDPTEVDDNDNAPVNGQIASGQAFFIRGIKNYEDLEVGNNPIKVKFKNAMRVVGNNSNFFKPGPTTPVENWETTGKHRFWVNLRNDEGAFNQALVGYIENATDGLDRLYDGELFGGNYVTIYSLLDQNKLTIQGKSLPFNEQDVVPLGYKVTIAGTFNISLDHFDGLFEGQDIFIKDNLLNIIHNLKDSVYSFVSAIGTFDNRFEIIYQNETLGIENPQINPESIIIFKNTSSAIVINAGLLMIDKVKVYDITGRLLHDSWKINSTETLIENLPDTQQVLIVNVVTNDGFKIARKIMF